MIRTYVVDAFTKQQFKGNPAAVCFLSAAADEVLLQKIAQEMNLSETAFLLKQEDGYNLRWFTPKVEVDLCGHATLASAHILWEAGYLERQQIAVFYTRSGILTAKCQADNWLELNFPILPVKDVETPSILERALGAKPKYVGICRFAYLVEIDSAEIICTLKPDFALLKKLSAPVIVTSLSENNDYDIISRFFAPQFGIEEDPVTGSAHCALAPYWQSRLRKNEFNAYQASARGGEIYVKITADRVYLSGQAVTVMQGELKI